MLAAVAFCWSTVPRIGGANCIAARAANFIETHFETAHTAMFVKIAAPPKPCAPRAFVVCIARRSSHCESEERQKSYFSHFSIPHDVGDRNSTGTQGGCQMISVRDFDSASRLEAPGNEEMVK
jgi:hypothetical protein